jgi:hypothetical protein
VLRGAPQDQSRIREIADITVNMRRIGGTGHTELPIGPLVCSNLKVATLPLKLLPV